MAGGLSRSFALYWAATTVSGLGSGVSLIALPLLAVDRLGAGRAGLLTGIVLIIPLTILYLRGHERVDRAIGWDDAVWLTWTPDAGVVLTR